MSEHFEEVSGNALGANKRPQVCFETFTTDYCRRVLLMRLSGGAAETVLDSVARLTSDLLQWLRSQLELYKTREEQTQQAWDDAFATVEAIATVYRRRIWVEKFCGIKPVRARDILFNWVCASCCIYISYIAL